MKDNYYAIILAGGSGTRLYPRSRNSKPKQFQMLFGDRSLVEQTYNRVNNFIPDKNIYISTNLEYISIAQKILNKIPKDNFIGEPCKKNTAAASALTTAIIYNKNPSAIIASLHSDHVVLKESNFTQVFLNAFDSIEKDGDSIITIGIQPTSPHIGYGYIERSKEKLTEKKYSIYKAIRFLEKPDKNTALEFLKKGTYYWNAGYFIYKAKHLLNEMHVYMPNVYKTIINNVNNIEKIIKAYPNFPDSPIDTAIMEKTKKLKIIPADLGWSDVGSWDSVATLIDSNKFDNHGNYCEGLTILNDTFNSIILNSNSDKLIATIGLDNIMVVESNDAILITQKGRSEEVKKIVEKLKEKKLNKLI